jgi:TDG/mug DNA glycosylase family protein
VSGIPDITCTRPTILFVGINPGTASGRVGHHFAGPGNAFWRLLHAAKLTPVELRPDEDGRLPEFQLALVNMAARTTRTAAELTKAELLRGRTKLLANVRAMQPAVVALVGVTLYPLLVGTKAAKASPGPGPKPELVEGARLFVVPNPSGLNATFPTFEAKLPWFVGLRAFAYPGRGKPSRTSA